MYDDEIMYIFWNYRPSYFFLVYVFPYSDVLNLNEVVCLKLLDKLNTKNLNTTHSTLTFLYDVVLQASQPGTSMLLTLVWYM